MNCEKCHEWIGDLLDGGLSHEDESMLNSHLEECLTCADVRNDLQSIVGFCRSHRGEYIAPPNERALWLRIRNMIEAERTFPNSESSERGGRQGFLTGWMRHSWELSLPQLVASTAAIVLVVSLATTVGLRRWQSSSSASVVNVSSNANLGAAADTIRDRMAQQQQAINYWNQRVEMNKARWNPQMRETFDRNLLVIDQAVNDSINDLSRNPHDEVSEEMLNAALSEKLALLKEFSDL
jgi:putative zinc finger protein